MPRKPNSSGEQQPYDKSTGEYSKTSNSINTQDVSALYKNVTNLSNIKKENKQLLQKVMQNGDEECNKVLNKVVSSGKCRYMETTNENSHCSAFDNSVTINIKDFDDDKLNEAFYHESGHLIDFSTDIEPLSYGYQSKKYGDTLNNVVREETKVFVASNDFYEIKELMQKVDDDTNEELSKKGYTIDRMNSLVETHRQYNLELTKGEEKIVEKYNKEFNDAMMSFGTASAEEVKARLDAIKPNKQRELENLNKSLQDKYSKDLDDYEKSQKLKLEIYKNKSGAFNRKYGTLADMAEALTLQSFVLGSGHGADYWRNRKGGMGQEFFAEAFSSKATTDGLEQIKKYFPKSYEIFEEILKEV